VSIVSGTHTLTCDPCLFNNEETCIQISPKCADEEDECVVYLSLQNIQKLQLRLLGQILTKKYGLLNRYSGIKMKLKGVNPNRKGYDHHIYPVPDGYVYELPEVYTSARMVPTSRHGIPERQGIIHRELFFDHGIINYKNKLYSVPKTIFGPFQRVIDAHPECIVPLDNGFQDDANALYLREMQEGNKFKDTPYCYYPDDIALDQFEEKFVYFQTSPKCANCSNLFATLYCPLCKDHEVQCPQVYCSEGN
jgi:hypothetical protein